MANLINFIPQGFGRDCLVVFGYESVKQKLSTGKEFT
jgi:hypothetical protein